MTYAFLAVYIAQAFFPASTAFASLLLALGALGGGYIFTPLLTIAQITVGTIGPAAAPSCDAIGNAAPIIVVSCRRRSFDPRRPVSTYVEGFTGDNDVIQRGGGIRLVVATAMPQPSRLECLLATDSLERLPQFGAELHRRAAGPSLECPSQDSRL